MNKMRRTISVWKNRQTLELVIKKKKKNRSETEGSKDTQIHLTISLL